jgi:hypothetical protein
MTILLQYTHPSRISLTVEQRVECILAAIELIKMKMVKGLKNSWAKVGLPMGTIDTSFLTPGVYSVGGPFRDGNLPAVTAPYLKDLFDPRNLCLPHVSAMRVFRAHSAFQIPAFLDAVPPNITVSEFFFTRGQDGMRDVRKLLFTSVTDLEGYVPSAEQEEEDSSAEDDHFDQDDTKKPCRISTWNGRTLYGNEIANELERIEQEKQEKMDHKKKKDQERVEKDCHERPVHDLLLKLGFVDPCVRTFTKQHLTDLVKKNHHIHWPMKPRISSNRGDLVIAIMAALEQPNNHWLDSTALTPPLPPPLPLLGASTLPTADFDPFVLDACPSEQFHLCQANQTQSTLFTGPVALCPGPVAPRLLGDDCSSQTPSDISLPVVEGSNTEPVEDNICPSPCQLDMEEIYPSDPGENNCPNRLTTQSQRSKRKPSFQRGESDDVDADKEVLDYNLKLPSLSRQIQLGMLENIPSKRTRIRLEPFDG